MDKALQDALRWFLDKELTAEIYAVQDRIDKTITDTGERVQVDATLRNYETTHDTLIKMWLALREQSGEAE